MDQRGAAWRLIGLCAAAASAGLALGALELLAASTLHMFRPPGITLTAAQAGAADLASFALGSLLGSLLAGRLRPHRRWLAAGLAAVLLGAGLGVVAPGLLGVVARGPADWPWRRAVAALSLGQLSAALVAALLWATPLPAGSPYVLLATMLAMAGFASGGLVPDTTLRPS